MVSNAINTRPTAPSAPRVFARGVLVVDDDCVQRERLSQVLRRVGETVICAVASGQEALECLLARPAEIGLVICDLQMPGMDGMALLRRIGECGHSPAIIISSAADAGIMCSVELMAKAVGLNVLGSLPKPVEVATMEMLLRGYHQAPASAPHRRTAELTSSELDRAFANGEIVPYFQPKVDLTTSKLAGVEALARWIHPLHGTLRPVDFLPLIESQGMLPQLTHAIVASTVLNASKWKDKGSRLGLNINLSLSAMDNRLFCEETLALLGEHGITPQDLTFEIVETAAMTDVGSALEIMTRLRLNGFGLAIDDFGIGFSSFEQLSTIPFTELKIDRSFVHGVSQTPRQAAVVRSCIDLARRLSLKVVAEGVESRNDWEFLVRNGAQEAQGYLIAEPMPAEQFLAWAGAWAQSSSQYQTLHAS